MENGLVILLFFCIVSTSIRKYVGFRNKKYLDMFKYITIYIIAVLFLNDQILIVCIIGVVCTISSVLQLILFTNKENKNRNEYFSIILVTCLIEYLVSMALTYYVLYMINTTWFEITSVYLNNSWQYLFEFIYLTFSVLTTYSSGNIALVGIVPRIFQMFHVIFALTILAKTLNLVLRKNE